MIDRIRHDIQERLDQLLGEADRLRQALTALGGERKQPATKPVKTTSGPSSAAPSAGRTTRSAAGTRSRGASGRTRASSGGTKNAVLKALGHVNGKAMTASEVAAATGLGRASVSTTLSKLAKAGDVVKAERGYGLGTPSTAAAEKAPAGADV
jgi:DNA-binding transcriptional ArsR family regulator